MYAMIAMWLEIIFIVEKFCQFCYNLIVCHYMKLNKILHYLKEIVDLGLIYDYSAITLTIKRMWFIDSTYADDSSDYCSIYDMTMILGQATCIWNNIK